MYLPSHEQYCYLSQLLLLYNALCASRGWKPVPKARSCHEYEVLPTARCWPSPYLGDMVRACEPSLLPQQFPAWHLVPSCSGLLGHAQYMLCHPYIAKMQPAFTCWVHAGVSGSACALQLCQEAIASLTVLHCCSSVLQLGDQMCTVSLAALS